MVEVGVNVMVNVSTEVFRKHVCYSSEEILAVHYFYFGF